MASINIIQVDADVIVVIFAQAPFSRLLQKVTSIVALIEVAQVWTECLDVPQMILVSKMAPPIGDGRVGTIISLAAHDADMRLKEDIGGGSITGTVTTLG